MYRVYIESVLAFPLTMQQATINLPSTNPVRALSGLARQIALPGEHAPERFPSFPALERTAVMGFTQPASWSVQAGVAAKGMLTRQATYPCWLDTTYSAVSSYHVIWASSGISYALATSAAGNTYLMQDAPILNFGTGPSTATPASQIGVTGSSSLSSFPLVAVDAECGPQPFVYVPVGFNAHNVIFGGTVFTSGSNAVVTYERWRAPGLVEPVIMTGVGISGGSTGYGGNMTSSTIQGYWIRPLSVDVSDSPAAGIPAGVYVSVIVHNASSVLATTSGSLPPTFTLSGPTTLTAMMPVAIPNEFTNSALPWQDTRLTACAGLFTNVTQVLNKGGTVLAGRISPNTANPWLVTKTQISALHPAEKAYLPLETGMYTYCPPSTDLASFWDYAQIVTFTGGTLPLYRLDNTSLVNHFFLDASVAGTIACNVSWHLEFRTTSSLFQVALSGLTLEALHASQLVLAQAGYFFENPEHHSVLEKVSRAARTIAPHLMNVAEMHPKGALIAAAVRSAHRAASGVSRGRKTVPVHKPKTNTTMKATSAQASGLVSGRSARNMQKKGKSKKR